MNVFANTLRWTFAVAFLAGTAPVFFAIWAIWRAVTKVIVKDENLYVRGDDFLYALYQKLIVFFYEHSIGTELIFYGDIDELKKQKENVFLIGNHQSNVDWMIADLLAVRQGSIGHIRYILKDSLKFIPMYGCYFKQHSCIYVKRSGNFQQQFAEQQLQQLHDSNTPFWMVVFPEGTRFRPDLPQVIEKSQAYARENKLPVLNNLLTPRSKALHLGLSKLADRSAAVYDITVAFEETLQHEIGSTKLGDVNRRISRALAPQLTEFLQKSGRRLHIHIERIDVATLPLRDRDKFDQWLMDRFVAKDKMLDRFFSADPALSGTLGPGGRLHKLSLMQTLPVFLFWFLVNGTLWLTATGRFVYLLLCVAGCLVSLVWALLQP